MSTDLHRCFKCNNPVDAVAKRWAPGYVCDRCIDQYAVVDPESAFELEPGVVASTWVESDGDTHIELGPTCDGGSEGAPWPAHEGLGPLPDEIRVKIRRARCGRLTRAGKPCRNRSWCKYHR